ncbi:MAG: tyrosine-type recombinase/integrase [Actinomycetota bacterium]|nr:tyrosine-type recombinase/integrase [Actinomycetota bacterium]
MLARRTDGAPLRRAGFRRNWWAPAIKAAGLDALRFHDLRHSYVSLALASGANIKKVSTWAGHSSVAFTLDRYGHLYEDDDDRRRPRWTPSSRAPTRRRRATSWNFVRRARRLAWERVA